MHLGFVGALGRGGGRGVGSPGEIMTRRLSDEESACPLCRLSTAEAH
jgi:hypothetical protein